MNSQQASSARLYDLAEYRMQRIARLRRVSGVKRRFLWSWPETGQLLAVDFPLSAASFSSLNARAR
jgi:hypothetical protein